MGIFDFFTKETERPAEKKAGKPIVGKPINSRSQNGGAIKVYNPKSVDDVSSIIDDFKHNQSAIVYTKDLKLADAMRVVDFLSGAIYALDGSVMLIEQDVYIFTLDGVHVNP